MNALRLSRSGGGKFEEQPAAGPMKLAIPNAFLQEEERRGLNHKATSDGPFPTVYKEIFKDLGLQLDEIWGFSWGSIDLGVINSVHFFFMDVNMCF